MNSGERLSVVSQVRQRRSFRPAPSERKRKKATKGVPKLSDAQLELLITKLEEQRRAKEDTDRGSKEG